MDKKILNLVLFSAALLLGYESYKLIKNNSKKKCTYEVIEQDSDDNVIKFDGEGTERKYITLRKAI